jgi:hypothetical protein
MFSTSMTDAGTTSMRSSISDVVDLTATSKSELREPAEEQSKQKLGHTIANVLHVVLSNATIICTLAPNLCVWFIPICMCVLKEIG